MQIPISATPLKSSGTANSLLPSLKVRFQLAVASCIFSLLLATLTFLYQFLGLFAVLVGIAALVVNLLTIILALIWLYQVHLDLKQFYPDYPIKPGEALAQFMIPFYNIWGIWNTLSTIAGRLKSEDGEIQQQGELVKARLPFLYILGTLSIVLNRVAYHQALSPSEGTLPFLQQATSVVDLGMAYILLEMGKAMIHAMNLKASSGNASTYTVDDMPPTIE